MSAEVSKADERGGENEKRSGAPVAPRSSLLRFRLALGLLLVVGVAAVIYFSPLRQWIDPARAAAWLRSVGEAWWAPLAFILLYCLFNVLLIPGTILSLTAGVIWGWLAGGLWVLAASTVGSAIPYFIARSGAGWVERQVRRRAGSIYERLRQEGFTTLLLMRLVPIVPYNVLNYAAGLAGIRPRDYLLATFLGTIPGIFIFTYLADAIAAGLISPGQAFVRILTAGLLFGALVLLTRLVSTRVKKRLAVK
jgi:uncharacterized membrane protein YdjX (TVP38/TMEM64 family)